MGWLWTLLLNGMPALGAWWTARHGLRQPRGLPATLAAAMLAWAWIILGMEVLGPFGLLGRSPLLAWSAAGLGIGLAARHLYRDRGIVTDIARELPGRPDFSRARAGMGAGPTEVGPTPRLAAQDSRDKDRPGPGDGWEFSAIVALGLVLAAAAILGGRSLMGPVKVVSDGPIYHLYFAARWWKAGRLFLIPTPFGESAAPYFPAVGDLTFTWLFIGWGGDRLAKVGQAPFFLTAGLAAFAIARRLGAGTSAAVIAVAWFLTSTPFLIYAFEPNVDAIFVAAYLVAAYFFLRFALGDGGAGALAIGALAAGGAWGTKPTATVFVPPLLAIAGLAVVLRPGRRLVHLGILAAGPMVLAGFWFARNAWLTGNPLYPLQVEALGRVWLVGGYGRDAMRRSPFYIAFDQWRALVDTIAAVLDPRLAPIWVMALAGAWAIGRRSIPRARWAWGASALALLNVGLYWALIPYRDQQRFMLQALGLAVAPLALTLDRGRWARWAGAGLLAVHMLTPQAWPFARPVVDLTGRVPNDVPALIEPGARLRLIRDGWEPAEVAWAVGPALIVLTAPVVALTIARLLERPSMARGTAAVGSAAVLAALATTTANLPAADPRLTFYPPFRDYSQGWLALDTLSGPAGARVAYAGTNIPYYLLGQGLRNEVRYVNVDAHRDWLLHDYHRAARSRGPASWPSPRPGWDRAGPDGDAWFENIQAEGIDFLFVTRVNPREGEHNVADRLGFPIERRFAGSRPEWFELVHADPEVRLYRVRRNPPGPATDGTSARHY